MTRSPYDADMASNVQRARWLITGATGFLGANLGSFLHSRTTTIGANRGGARLPFFDEVVGGDLEDFTTLAAQIKESRPTVIVHAAAMASHESCETNPERAQRINADATGALAHVAQEISARFVYISTDAVFDGERGRYAEGDTPNPTSVYGRTKLQGEQRAAEATDALIIRTNFFGWSPSGSRSILEFFVNELSQEHAVRGFTDFTTSSAYAQVLTQTISDLIDADASGLFHVTSPDALTKYEFGVAVAEEFGLDAGLITPTTADIQPPRNGNISLDVSKVQQVLKRTLPTQREGLRHAHTDAPTLREALRPLATP
jgi:dTDP-4-dehydrorhamnose reductase